jgi:hypothetical protein
MNLNNFTGFEFLTLLKWSMANLCLAAIFLLSLLLQGIGLQYGGCDVNHILSTLREVEGHA